MIVASAVRLEPRVDFRSRDQGRLVGQPEQRKEHRGRLVHDDQAALWPPVVSAATALAVVDIELERRVRNNGRVLSVNVGDGQLLPDILEHTNSRICALFEEPSAPLPLRPLQVQGRHPSGFQRAHPLRNERVDRHRQLARPRRLQCPHRNAVHHVVERWRVPSGRLLPVAVPQRRLVVQLSSQTVRPRCRSEGLDGSAREASIRRHFVPRLPQLVAVVVNRDQAPPREARLLGLSLRNGHLADGKRHCVPMHPNGQHLSAQERQRLGLCREALQEEVGPPQ